MFSIYEGDVVGVGYDNPDGSSRQKALAAMRPWRETCQGKLKLGEYEGRPSLAVEWTVVAGNPRREGPFQIGFLPERDVSRVLDAVSRLKAGDRHPIELATVLFEDMGENSRGVIQANIRVLLPVKR